MGDSRPFCVQRQGAYYRKLAEIGGNKPVLERDVERDFNVFWPTFARQNLPHLEAPRDFLFFEGDNRRY
jgi:hypothetical protein